MEGSEIPLIERLRVFAASLSHASSLIELAQQALGSLVEEGFVGRAFIHYVRADGSFLDQIVTRDPAEAQAYQVRGLAGMAVSRAVSARQDLFLPALSDDVGLASEAEVYEVDIGSALVVLLGDPASPVGGLYLDRCVGEPPFTQLELALARHHATLLLQACVSLDRHDAMARRHDHMESLLGIIRTVSGVMELPTLLDHLTQMALTVIKAERAFVLLVERDELKYGAGRDREGVLTSASFKRISSSVCKQVLDSGKEVCVLDAGSDESFAARQSVVNLQLQGVVAVPLIGREGMLGIVYVDSRTRNFEGLKEEMKLLRALGNVASAVVENARMYQRVTVEPRTGLFTRGLLAVRLEEEIVRSRRYKRPFSFLLFALDDLRVIEETRGRDRAEVALRMVAQVVRMQARGGIDFPARFSDDRIALILPETPMEGAWILAERIREKVSKAAFAGSDGSALSLTVSVGAAGWLPPDGTSARLIEEVIGALEEAIDRGGNVTVASA